MDEVLGKLRGKGRELLVMLTAAAILLSMALGAIGDMMLILIVGALGWFASDPDDKPKP